MWYHFLSHSRCCFFFTGFPIRRTVGLTWLEEEEIWDCLNNSHEDLMSFLPLSLRREIEQWCLFPIFRSHGQTAAAGWDGSSSSSIGSILLLSFAFSSSSFSSWKAEGGRGGGWHKGNRVREMGKNTISRGLHIVMECLSSTECKMMMFLLSVKVPQFITN